MEIDNNAIKVFRTYLQEVWPKADVTDEMIREQIEMMLIISVFNETQRYDLPKSMGALYDYYGVTEDDLVEEDADSEENNEA